MTNSESEKESLLEQREEGETVECGLNFDERVSPGWRKEGRLLGTGGDIQRDTQRDEVLCGVRFGLGGLGAACTS